MNDLIKGAYDLHVHSGPDMLPRKVDDPELADRFIKSWSEGVSDQVPLQLHSRACQSNYYVQA